MAKDPDDIVPRHLREIRAVLKEHAEPLQAFAQALARIEKQLGDLTKLVTYSLGQSTETQFRQSQQEKRIDDLFEQLEKLLKPREPA